MRVLKYLPNALFNRLFVNSSCYWNSSNKWICFKIYRKKYNWNKNAVLNNCHDCVNFDIQYLDFVKLGNGIFKAKLLISNVLIIQFQF